MLARAQSQLVANALESAHPGIRVELVILKTSGDQIVDRPLHEVGGKGLFTKELEQALLAGEIDFAVHSFKDVPVTMPLVRQDELVIAAVPMREDPRDVLASNPLAETIDALPQGARVGTGSLRRRCQLRSRRPDLRVEAIRGNIDTRLRKLREGQFDAVVLAMAGIARTGLFDPSLMSAIPDEVMLPAPGQGALALQCRRSDERISSLLRVLDDADTARCVRAERALVVALEGDCLSPIAALGEIGADLHLRACVGGRGGEGPVITTEAHGDPAKPEAVADAVFAKLRQQDAMSLLHGRR